MKDITKTYLEQCFDKALTGIQLKAGQVEIVTKLRELLFKGNNIKGIIERMKKSTELSTFGIKVGEAYAFIEENEIDFSSVSHHFNEHTEKISQTIRNLIESVSWENFQRTIARLNELELAEEEGKKEKEEQIEFMLDYKPTENDDEETLEMKKDFILDDEVLIRDISFDEYREKILDSVKKIDELLNNLQENNYNDELLLKCIKTVETNKTLSENHNFEIITKMHGILADSLKLVGRDIVKINNQLIYAMRSCLIVIVAIIKDKKVDITEFLERAEFLGRELDKIKQREVI